MRPAAWPSDHFGNEVENSDETPMKLFFLVRCHGTDDDFVFCVYVWQCLCL